MTRKNNNVTTSQVTLQLLYKKKIVFKKSHAILGNSHTIKFNQYSDCNFDEISISLSSYPLIIEIKSFYCFVNNSFSTIPYSLKSNAERIDGNHHIFILRSPQLNINLLQIINFSSFTLSFIIRDAGSNYSIALFQNLFQELLAAHRLIDSLNHESLNLKNEVLSIRTSITWKFGKLIVSPFILLFGDAISLKISKIFKNLFHKPKIVSPDKGFRTWQKNEKLLIKQLVKKNKTTRKYSYDVPLVSILLPTYNTPPKLLKECIKSVRKQSYQNWELCIADDNSPSKKIKQTLERLKLKDKRIRVTYRKKNGHISKASNSALAMASGEYVTFLDHDDYLPSHSLDTIFSVIKNDAKFALIYTDEDKLTPANKRYHPHFKPEWNPGMMLSQNYICHLSVIKRSLVERIGGFRIGLEGSQDYDLILRLSLIIPKHLIAHIPVICYHWRAVEGSTALSLDYKSYCSPASRQAITDYLYAKGFPARAVAGIPACINRVDHSIDSDVYLSIIIPTKDQSRMLRLLIDDLQKVTDYTNYEILVIENNSLDYETFEYLKSISDIPHIQIHQYTGKFNYSSINNFAAKLAKGNVICFMNNDLRNITPDWMGEMIGHALHPETGAVGAKLLYSDNTIQHAGLILGLKDGIAESQFLGISDDIIGYSGRTHILQNISAVTAACLVIEKEKFFKAGGFDEVNLKISFNDIDLCLRLKELGYKNIFTPFAKFYHFESTTRGSDITENNLRRFQKEIAYMKRIWISDDYFDEYYNLNLSRNSTNFELSKNAHLHVIEYLTSED